MGPSRPAVAASRANVSGLRAFAKAMAVEFFIVNEFAEDDLRNR